MIFFGHLGITTGIVNCCEKILNKDKELKDRVSIDYRFILIGSILPDIIDKPIGAFLFRSTFHNSRIFAHTLIFSVMLLAVGVYMFFRDRNENILLLGIGSFIHLLLDSMWLYNSILFWPYFGWTFPSRPEGDWLKEGIIRLFTDPSYFLAEIVGVSIILYQFVKLKINGSIKSFINEGSLCK